VVEKEDDTEGDPFAGIAGLLGVLDLGLEDEELLDLV
jgi:hypothetical protein